MNLGSIKFLGHIIDKEGLRADPDKTAAIVKMEPPKSVSELRRFLGMANQLGKFSPSLALGHARSSQTISLDGVSK